MLLEMILVIAITDGDTIKVLDPDNKQIKVRLASIDAQRENNRSVQSLNKYCQT